MTTERDATQLEGARRYVETIGHKSEDARDYPPRPNPNCVHCDHRAHCPAYASDVAGVRHVVCDDLDDLELVAREREEVARLSKVLAARKQELEAVLKSKLEHADEVVAGGMKYRMLVAASKQYPLDRTLDILARTSGRDRDALVQRLASVDNTALEGLVKELAKELGRDRVNLLKAELETVAERQFSQRFSAKEVS
jgi:predicted NBD/HSP70 family sugar kinase